MSPAKKKNSSPEGVLACDNDLTFTFVTTGCLPTAVVHMHTRGRIHAHTHTKTTKTAATRWRHHQGWCTHPRVIRLHRLTPLPPCTTGQSLAFIKQSMTASVRFTMTCCTVSLLWPSHRLHLQTFFLQGIWSPAERVHFLFIRSCSRPRHHQVTLSLIVITGSQTPCT